ncbi:carboxylesterase family protein [Archangium violaceum]|uniref:carboxylesterase/lipase family protein n=1 Tax=Archangium violaceum TaxID=83451 RepID=UPI0019509DFD|nr:carboxylesterase/lipase family protein [Archangium violaceum]QRN96042.1 carboxylesterase family protein [Archangium violaceum]
MRLPFRLSLLSSLAALALLTHCAHSKGPALASGPAPVVATDKGPVRGLAYADGSAAFLGIPFAAPPTGALRWRAPQPAEAWTTPREATRFGSACPQVEMFSGKAMADTSEDCLSLNVWTPALQPATRAPVMVWIHGGGFTMGSSGFELYDGAALSRSGVVVVSMNYRLGALGFLGHPALGAENANKASGNYGLMDQRRALEWVRDNIAAFGGDPDNVTLFGESAGAISACLQMVSPQAQGLFKRVIAESGTCYLTGVPLRDPGTPREDSAEERGLRLAKELGCTDGDVAGCLRTRTPEQLLAASGAALDLLKPHVGFAPIIDGDVLPAAPRQLLAEGKYAKVPLLLGTNKDEGTLFTIKAKLSSPEQYEEALRVRSPEHAEELLRLYPAKSFASPHAAYDHMLRDALFLCPARRLARTVVEHGQPVYAYHFTYEPKSLFGAFYNLGAAHAAELPFVFGAEKGRLSLGSDKERELSAKIIGYWTRFATQADPNGKDATEWPAYTREGEPHLVLDMNLERGERLDQEHCDELEKLGL